MKKIFGLLLAGSCFLAAHAQPAQEPTAEEKAWMAYMTPGPAHKMLADADGEWTEEMTIWMAPGAEPMKNTAACVNKMILGGRYQESRHSGNFMGMPFEGVSTVAYDNAMKKYLSTWIDNMGTGLMYMEGVYDEATKAVHFKGKMVDPCFRTGVGLSGDLLVHRQRYPEDGDVPDRTGQGAQDPGDRLPSQEVIERCNKKAGCV